MVLKERVEEGPSAMICRINAGFMSPDSWIQDKDIGGGRIISEVCHFVDYLSYINGSKPQYVFANVMRGSLDLLDTINISLEFKNGSIGTISYFSNGSESVFKEYFEIYKSGYTAILKDFKEVIIYGTGKSFKKKKMSQDKGQRNMIMSIIDSIKSGKSPPIDLQDIFIITKTTLKILESISTKKVIRLSY